MKHIEVLSSDEFEGRLPGTKGEELTVDYLVAQFNEIGLEPGNPDGSFIQEVPLAGYNSASVATLTAGGKRLEVSTPDDYMTGSRRLAPEVDVTDSEVVFVGYGVVAPEYGWDDYKGADVAGKTLLMLINDPAVPDHADSSKLDKSMFNGEAMTYYGRWTYKFEIGAEKGAAAVIIVHETGPAGYPWEVVRNSWGGESFDLQSPDDNMSRLAIEGWMTESKATELLGACGEDFESLKRAAVRDDFQPVSLDAKASFHNQNVVRRVQSRNVIGKIEGSDPEGRDEYVIYTAHWDHLGRDESIDGDQIFSGAYDNASGTAGILEIARAFMQLNPRPKRSILFMALTAEEQGLLGAKFWGENPLYPHAKTVANINIDGLNPWGRTRDLEVVGYGNSTLDDVAEAVAKSQGRIIVPDTSPEKGYFYRADHFEFAKQGVPALYTHSGIQFIDRAEGWGAKNRERFTADDYHKPSDTIKDDWDLSGAVADAQFMFEVGLTVARTDTWPEWKAGTEFRAKREAMLG